jgi:hypothetical protein
MKIRIPGRFLKSLSKSLVKDNRLLPPAYIPSTGVLFDIQFAGKPVWRGTTYESALRLCDAFARVTALNSGVLDDGSGSLVFRLTYARSNGPGSPCPVEPVESIEYFYSRSSIRRIIEKVSTRQRVLLDIDLADMRPILPGGDAA